MLTTIATLRHVSQSSNMAVQTQSYNMADAPLTYSKYPFLKELGLEEENPGCYNGTWCGSGALYTSLNPTTGPS